MVSIYFPTDQALARRAIRGDKQAFGRLFDRHGAYIIRLLRRLTANPELAEDLTQETFIAAYSALDGWQGKGSFPAWLRGIAVRKYAASQRFQFKQPLVEPFDDEADQEPFLPNDDPLSHCKRREADAALSEAIAALSESCREVFILVRLEDMPYQSVADLLDIPIGTVQSRLNRAIRFLHRRLSPLIYGADPIGSAPHSTQGARHDIR